MKKVISMILAVIMIASVFSITATATSKDTSFNTEESSLIYFDANTVGWKNYKKIFCCIRRTNGHLIYPEHSEESLCTDTDGDGIWSYDMSDLLHLFDTYTSLVIRFYTENGNSTSTLNMQKSDIGDIVFSTSMQTSGTPIIRWLKDKSVKDAVNMYESKYDVKLETNRYYFLMPNGENGQKGDDPQSTAYGKFAESWCNEYSEGPAVFWWDSGEYDPPVYPGYNLQHLSGGVYYADIPKEVKQIIFSNDIEVSFDAVYDPMVNFVRETIAIDTENKNEMIYIIDPDKVQLNGFTEKQIYDGDWYHYYGYGCYGTEKNGDSSDCIRDDHHHGEPICSDISAKDALSQYESQTGEKVSTYRYYFMMPNGENGDRSDDPYGYSSEFVPSWYNEYTDAPAIYWWDTNLYNPEEFPGYTMEKGDTADVFFADVPVEVTTIIFNNNVVFPTYDIMLGLEYDRQSINIPSEYYDPGESPNYPEGTESFDNMIFVLDPDIISIGELGLKQTYAGEWYYYYGDNCYGLVKDGDESNCLHPSHFDEDGNHIDFNILGDTDRDGVVSVMDATEIQMVLAQLKAWADEKAEVLADFDDDSEVSVLDATAIQLKLAQLSY